MNQQKRKDSAEHEHGSRLEKPAELGSGKSLFQLALEVEDLLDRQKLKRYLEGVGIQTRYIE